jgi:hypothetical protein
MFRSIILSIFLLGLSSLAVSAALPSAIIHPGERWLDDRGRHIQAHGGGITQIGDTYYWFGEDRTLEDGRFNPTDCFVACYSSQDLVNWKFRHQVIAGGPPPGLAKPFVLERPKVFANTRTGKFVMYVHLDAGNKYTYARVGVYVSDKIDGDYAFVHSFRPLDQESRDIGQFVDDDGSAYLIFEARPTKGFFITKLSADYLTVEKEVCFIPSRLEGGALVKYDGLYYVVGSWMKGWHPNPNQYATASSLAGPWSAFHDIAPPATNTYGSQSTFLLKVVGTQKTSVIFMGDIWKPKEQRDARYLWMPLEIGGGKMHLPKPCPWTIDLQTGITTIR